MTQSLREFGRAVEAGLVRDTSPVSGVIAAIEEHLGAAAVAHRPERGRDGWVFENIESSDHALAADFAERIQHAPTSDPLAYMGWHPLTVAPKDQNLVLGHSVIHRVFEERSAPVITDVYEPLGLLRYSHIRVLVSDGAFLLRWLGLFREDPFTPAEERALESVAPAIARRLATDRILATTGGAVGDVLELVGLPAFLVDRRKRIALVNEAAQALLEKDPSVAALVVDAAASGIAGARVHAVVEGSAQGLAGYRIVLLKDLRDALAVRLACVVRDAALTPTEVRVLERLVHGDANKDIAVKLRCAPRTVEAHASSILTKCRVDSRARLVAWFWTR